MKKRKKKKGCPLKNAYTAITILSLDIVILLKGLLKKIYSHVFIQLYMDYYVRKYVITHVGFEI